MIAWMLLAWGAQAAPSVGELRVPTAYREIAREEAVSPRWLYAIALAESGVRLAGNRRPWPWTLNVRGRGFRYETRSEAEQALRRAVERTPWVDVGLMQVSWRYHRSQFRDLGFALDPYVNLRAGARILRACHDRSMSWSDAAGCYHAPNHAERAKRYAARVGRMLGGPR